MALHGFEQHKKGYQNVGTQTYSFTVEPLFCEGCLGRIRTAFVRNGISAACEATRYGDRDGNKAGDLQITVNSMISSETLVDIMQTKMGLKFPNEVGHKKGYGL